MKYSRRRSWLLPVLITISIAAAIFAVSEAAARSWASANHLAYAYPSSDTRPPALDNAPYWSPLFQQEQEAVRTHAVDTDGLPFAVDYAGQYVNVRNGIRQTTDQPEGNKPTVYVFGASQIFGLSVSDQYTVPSALQRLVGSSYRVENRGGIGYRVARQLAYLRRTPLRPGDVVIWYDGSMDAIETYEEAGYRRTMLCSTLNEHLHHLVIIRLLTDSCMAEHALDSDILDQAASTYRRDVEAAEEYARAAGAAFYHFAEALVFSMPLSAVDTEGRCGAYLSYYPHMDRTFIALWPRYVTWPGTVDLAHSLDELRQREAVYIDCYHVNGEANTIIARAIFDYLTIY